MGSQTALARALGVSHARVWNWLNRDDSVPAEVCRGIESATGGRVTVHELRPDVFGESEAVATTRRCSTAQTTTAST